jgi:hypothetical protein
MILEQRTAESFSMLGKLVVDDRILELYGEDPLINKARTQGSELSLKGFCKSL